MPAPRAPVSGQAGQVRHLLYHLYPLGDLARTNLGWLMRRIHLFNGRRFIALALGPETYTRDELDTWLRAMHAEVLVFDNDRTYREMATYPALLRSLACYRGPADVTFYGHGKGVTSELTRPAVALWRDAMYEGCLDYWPLVARCLKEAAAVGQFLRPRHIIHGSRCKWHFSGNFHWHRNQDLYAREWDVYDRHWCGAESHLGCLFNREEVHCLYGEHCASGLGLYLQQTWDGAMTAQHRRWTEEHAADRRDPHLLSVVLTAAKQRELVHQAIASVQAQRSDEWELIVMDAGEMLAEGVYDRYRGDGRIRVVGTGETAELRSRVGIQAWAINEAWRRDLVRGDLACYLCDDDYLAPGIVGAWIKAAEDNPMQAAWYGPALRVTRTESGNEIPLGKLATVGTGGQGNRLDCRVDGMQVCHRRSYWTPWPEEKADAWHADGLWMDLLALHAPIVPIDELVGVHRHTPLSTFTQGNCQSHH